jgi:hypothetical protein
MNSSVSNPTYKGISESRSKEDLRIAGLFQYVANYSKPMENTRIKLSRLKLLHEKNEVEK